MKRSVLTGLFGVLLAFVGWSEARAQTATVELSPASSSIVVGDWVHVFVAGRSFQDGTDGGDFSLAWTPNLALVGLSVDGSPWDVSAVDATNAANGSVGSVDVFASTGKPGLGGAPFPIARLTLRSTAAGAASVTLGGDLVGWSLDGNQLGAELGPEATIEVTSVPEPGIGGALAIGIGLLGSLGRMRRPSGRPERGR